MQKRLFIVSNRLPVTIETDQGKSTIRRSSGGLISAVSGYLSHKGKAEFTSSFWIGVPGCNEKTWSELYIPENDYEFLPVFMPSRVYDSYYNGFSNSVVWPLFHYFPSYAEYNTNYFLNYTQANDIFAEALLKELREDDVVWIHDYHLMPLAAILRERMPGLTIGFFLHIPFPSYELFRMLPQKWQYKLLEGLLGADLIGFHTIDYASHFLECTRILLKLENDGHYINYNNRKIKADIFPISIDYQLFSESCNRPDVCSKREELRKLLDGKKLIFSVDRLDYTKGVSNRLRAYELFLRRFPQHHGKIVFNLVVIPSRDNIFRYAERKRMIDEFIGNLNSKVGSISWQPVIYRYTHLEFDELCALYSGCDIALITPLRDGMNLVSKEFVACRKQQDGVLILSDMAGAAKELTDALIINPNDVEELSEKIEEAVLMPVEEQRTRMQHMQKQVSRYDINAWAGDFFKQLYYIKSLQLEYETRFMDNPTRVRMFFDFKKAHNRLLLLDYDGSLTPFASTPMEARPGSHLLDILDKLTEDPANSIYIISGRDERTLDDWFADLKVNLVAEHGASVRLFGKPWKHYGMQRAGWKEDIAPIMDHYIARSPRSFVEQKKYSLAWHYRQSEPVQGRLRARELMKELDNVAMGYDLEVLDGNKVVEVRNKGVNKGVATERIMSTAEYDFILAIGDDKTDEDMFRQLALEPHAYTIKIGEDASFAKYHLHTPFMVHSLLDSLNNLKD